MNDHVENAHVRLDFVKIRCLEKSFDLAKQPMPFAWLEIVFFLCRQQIMAALNAQTHAQFQQYAAQQYPGNPEQVRENVFGLFGRYYQRNSPKAMWSL